jgi:signal transduction histidine kinase
MNVRLRLTLLYGGLFLISGVALLGVTYALVVGGSGDVVFKGVTFSGKEGQGAKEALPKLEQLQQQGSAFAAQAESERASEHSRLLVESAIALALMTVVSVGLGWLMAGRVLRPLEESYEAQRRFVANASHELRTPLTMMRTSLDVSVAKPAARVDALEPKLREGLDRADRLLESFLVLARAQHGEVGERGPVSLPALVRAALGAEETAIGARGLRIETALGEATVEGNEVLLGRLVGNLIENAVRHNQLDGRLRVETAMTGGRARILVESDGPPLGADAVRELAQPFRRLGTERTESGPQGQGLGLSIVAAIAAAHGGALDLRARPEGGLVAAVDLPAVAAPVPA